MKAPVDHPLPAPDEYHVVTAFGGLWFMNRQDYFDLGGYDETYRGWGGEDTDFLHRMREVGSVLRTDGVILHLWHERKKWEEK